ncbi:hypothetical protein H0H81_012318 [Sphagnurus paluster]|uniref:Uncharacterized protein n=1 Tax=Sphagnurus paluster TaxID=117069 RepID=A0A9P7GP03_9AGAR|nr:hypothetical protein H0H81_012318 [Sphagnurus paluster]
MHPSGFGRRRAHTLDVQVPQATFQTPLTSLTQIEPARAQASPHSRRQSASSTEPLGQPKRTPSRRRSSKNELGTFASPQVLFTPADTPPAYSPTPTSPKPAQFTSLKSSSSPLLNSTPPLSPYGHTSRRMAHQVHSDSEEDDLVDEPISWSASTGNLQVHGATTPSGTGFGERIFRIGAPFRHRGRPKTISTTPGELGAGETETEIDEPPRHLPTARIIHPSGPLVPPNNLEQRLTPLLFEFSRLLSIVPAFFGTLINLIHAYQPPPSRTDGRYTPQRVDFAISALWAILTGWQCLCLTTGLLTRWRLYYPPLSTLIRLLALQGICWPATQLTCTILEVDKRPVVVWAVIATTTSVSRGVQIWVTSNLWWETREVRERDPDAKPGEEKPKIGYWKRWGGGKWGGRRWDWKEVSIKCVLPAGIVYFIMAWAEQLRREFSSC